MRLALPLTLAALAALAACKKEAAPAAGGGSPITASTTDALWAFAPADVKGAVVVADGVLATVHGGALRALADLEKAPGGGKVAKMVREELSDAPIDLFDPAAIAAAGLDLNRGVAVFMGATAKVAVLPVADAKKLLARFGGTTENGVDKVGKLTCRAVGDRYVCADTLANLEVAAKAGGAAAVAGWSKETRGNVEIYVSPEELGRAVPLEAPQGLRIAAVIERGAATIRAHMVGKPTGPIANVRGARSPLTDGLGDANPVGLLVVGAAAVWEQRRAEVMADAPADPLPGGVTLAELAASIRGDIVGHAPPGDPPRGLVRIGLSNEAPMKKLIAACGVLAAGAPPGITVTSKGERCTVTADPTALGAPIPGLPAQSVDIWVEKGALVIGLGDQAAKSDAKPGLDPFAAELLAGDWLGAAWGRGALVAGPIISSLKAQDPTGGLALWAVSHLNELGMAVNIADDGIHVVFRARTLWANPDQVVAAVQAASGAADPTAAIQKIAAEHPDSPFARDLAAGQAGLTVQLGAVGMLAAIAIPSFKKYEKRSIQTEAHAHLQKIAMSASQYALEHAGGAPFPQPSAGPTPPLGECCRQGGKCAPEPKQWEVEPWLSLKFSLDDPHYYSYEYKVEGSSFTVIARGDLDCDGVYSTFTLRGPGGADARVEAVDEME